MKEVLESIIVSLVENKVAVEITEKVQNESIEYEVKVDKKDMGRVIGKQGIGAKSIRTVMKAVAAQTKKKVTVEFVG